MNEFETGELRSTLATLESKNAHLERRYRNCLAMASLSMTLTVFVVAGELTRQSPSEITSSTIIAKQLRIEGAGSKAQIMLGINDASKPSISFRNGAGTYTLALGINREDQPGLILSDHSGVARVELGLAFDRGGTACSLKLRDRGGRNRLELGVSPDDLPQIEELDSSGTIRLGMFVTSDDCARLQPVDGNSTYGIRVDAPRNSKPQIITLDGPAK
jgi:hypothetical protein